MIDINFYQKSYELKKNIMKGEKFDRDLVSNELEKCISDTPVLFNIETTNFCPAKCSFCPRTTMMTRPLAHLDMATFDKVIEQLKPWTKEEWDSWINFAKKEYGIFDNEMSENHFFTNISAKAITFHQYGDPLTDPYLATRIEKTRNKDLEIYFSCNPSILKVDKTIEMMKAGLNYVKYSIDSVYDEVHKQLRGKMTNFTQSYEKICKVLEEKEKNNFGTTIIITMIDLGRETQQEEWQMLQEYFKGKDVYIYLKSQDQTYLEEKELKNQSIDWREYCQYPWSSLSVKSDGKVAVCNQDFNNMIIVGDAKIQSLYDIWHSKELSDFRKSHLDNKPCTMCSKFCNKRVIGSYNLIQK